MTDGVHEVRPQQLNVVSVRFLKFGISVQDLLAFARWVKSPAIAPANMEHALGAIIIGANLVLFVVVLTKLPVFPNAGEFFELVGCNLMIRRIRGLLFFVEHCRTTYRPSSRAKNTLRLLSVVPPEHLIEPVRTPITERPVCVIQKIAPATRMEALGERTLGGRPAPEIPIEVGGRRFIQGRRLAAAPTVRE